MSEPIRVLNVVGRMGIGGIETLIMNIYRNIDKSKVQFDFLMHMGSGGAYEEEIRALGAEFTRCPLSAIAKEAKHITGVYLSIFMH